MSNTHDDDMEPKVFVEVQQRVNGAIRQVRKQIGPALWVHTEQSVVGRMFKTILHAMIREVELLPHADPQVQRKEQTPKERVMSILRHLADTRDVLLTKYCVSPRNPDNYDGEAVLTVAANFVYQGMSLLITANRGNKLVAYEQLADMINKYKELFNSVKFPSSETKEQDHGS